MSNRKRRPTSCNAFFLHNFILDIKYIFKCVQMSEGIQINQVIWTFKNTSLPYYRAMCLWLCKNMPKVLTIVGAFRCFSETLSPFLWSNGCWQLDLWFLCLSKSSLNIWKFTVHILLKPGLENFEHHFTSLWDECNCAIVWAFFGIAFLWDWNENMLPLLGICMQLLHIHHI